MTVKTHHWVLLRHGESTANAADIFSGWDDVALTARGRLQAAEAATALADVPIHNVLTSDLQRAIHTAEIIIQKLGISPTRHPPLAALRERNLGRWQGQPRSIIRAEHPSALTSWTQAAPDGESLASLAARTVAALADYTVSGSSTLLVAHGGVIRVLIGLANGIPTHQVGMGRVPNAVPIHLHLQTGVWRQLRDTLSKVRP